MAHQSQSKESEVNTRGGTSTDEVFTDSKKKSSSTQLLHFAEDESAGDNMGEKTGNKKYTVVHTPKDLVKCKVQLLDGSDYELEISKSAIGEALLDLVCEHLNLLEKDYFCCQYNISPDVKVWVQNNKPLNKQIRKNNWVFSLALKFYPQDPTALHEEITRYQVYLQLRKDVFHGKLPCSFVTMALLGSYAMQSQLGDYDTDDHGSGIDYIKEKHFAPEQTLELLEKIAELHRTHRGQSPPEAEYHYLDNAKNVAMYGVHQHPAVNEAGEEVVIGVCAAGILVFRQRIRMYRFIWVKILKITYKSNRFTVILRPDAGESKPKTIVYRMASYKAAKRLWKLAVEHHTFFRLRESEPEARGLFGRKPYYAGRTQYQQQQAADQIQRPGQDFNRVYYTVGRGGKGGLDDGAITPGLSTDRSEETIADNAYRTMTLDLKRKDKYSAPFADTTDGSDMDPRYGGGGGMDGPSVTLLVGPGDGTSGVTYSKTPYPTGPGYLTPGGGPGLNTPGYGTFNSQGGYNTLGGSGYPTPGGSPYFVDDMHRQHGGSTDDPHYYQNQQSMARYGGSATPGTPGSGQMVDEHGNIIVTKNVYIKTVRTVNGMPVDDDGLPSYQDDHLKQHGHGYGADDGTWGPYSTTSTTKTMTRTYTAPDGTIVTERRTEKNGVVETHIEKKTQMVEVEGDIDYDRALADAIKSVTDMNPNLTVEKIEIRQQED